MSTLGPLDPSALRPGHLDDAAGAPAAGGAGATTGPSFAETLSRAVSDVEQLQLQGDRNADAVALGGGNLHETALALEKADVALRVAVKVRNKLVEAYQDIMRMSV